MSKIALTPNASGSGTFTIASPNSDTDRTLDLPDGAGTLDRLERAGNVLQVVTNSYNTTTSTTSDSFSSTGLSASITPSSTTSKILVQVTLPMRFETVSGFDSRDETGGSVCIQRAIGASTTTFGNAEYEVGAANWGSSVNAQIRMEQHVNIQSFDSPSSTSSVTYTVLMRARVGGPDRAISAYAGENCYITLMEIAA